MNEYFVKVEIRDYLIKVRPYINLTGIGKEIGVSRQAISTFLMDVNHLGVISVSKLIKLRDFIQNL